MKQFIKIALSFTALSSLVLMGVMAQDGPPSSDKGGGKKGGKKGGPPPQTVWSPKSTKLLGWTAPNKPHWKLAEILAAHKGKASWSLTVVNDDHLHGDYIQMAA